MGSSFGGISNSAGPGMPIAGLPPLPAAAVPAPDRGETDGKGVAANGPGTRSVGTSGAGSSGAPSKASPQGLADAGAALPPPPPIASPVTAPSASANVNLAAAMARANVRPGPAQPAAAPVQPEAGPVQPEAGPADSDLSGMPEDGDDDHDFEHYETNDATPNNRVARRRPAGPVRHRMAANDDVPSIGGLIYALEQKPSGKVFRQAGIVSAIWAAIGISFTAVSLINDPSGASWGALLTRPSTFLMLSAIVVPVAVIWFLALLAWRAEELRLRSSTMTEVAVRLAEPDRMAEDSIASLGQAVRRQVGFMNEAVGRALGRAGELEALVHNEVAALENSYEENELRIRGLISELAGERQALAATSSSFNDTLRTLGNDVPELIEKLSSQQANLAKIIQGAAENLNALESTLSRSVGSLENELGGRTQQLQDVLEGYTGALGTALGTRTEQLRTLLEGHSGQLSNALGGRTDEMQKMLEAYTGALSQALGSRTEQMHSAFSTHMQQLDTAIANRTNNLQTVFEEYARALDTTLASRSEHLDQQIVERTRALDSSFNERLRLFDDTIQRSTLAIDRAVEARTNALTGALENHAQTFSETISRQAVELDEQLNLGISSVRRTSENITRQSLKAIDSLAGQSEMLRNVSENLLSQINTVTNRFESQGHSILQAASALESANHKIDKTLQARHTDLSNTLERLDGKANEFSRYVADYSTTIAGSISDAEERARAAAEQLRLGTDTHRQLAMSEIERLRMQTDQESERALEDLKNRLTSVSAEVSTQLGSLTNRFDETSEEVRIRTRRVADELAREQSRMTAELDRLPKTTRESADAMRRALQDQLRALDQLSSLTTREAQRRDIALPVAHGGALDDAPPAAAPSATAMPATSAAPPAQQAARPDASPQRSLTSLTASLAEELSARGRTRPAAPEAPVAPGMTATSTPIPPPPHDPRDTWSLGDLLKRASRDEDPAGGGRPADQRSKGTGGQSAGQGLAQGLGQGIDQKAGNPAGGTRAPAPHAQSPHAPVSQAPVAQAHGSQPQPSRAQASYAPAATAPSAPFSLNIEVLSQALDSAAAGAIWSRLRSGQRSIMVRSIYTAEGRAAFEELARRYPSDSGLQGTVNRYLTDFERILRDAEAKDQTGRLAQAHMTSAMGRVYLVLAHASGRIT
ncbi:MAG: hypothetical protein KDJ37_07130 [Hyphomicrobiaceae bacterium]|nr:hypothetical protein [Hyphomicrobiaceae bacterium]